jgi:hypothetical protein
MLLIEVWANPGYTFPEYRMNECPREDTRYLIRKVLGPDIHGLFVSNTARFGMDAGTLKDGVSVNFFYYDEDDINPAQIRIRVLFNGYRPKRTEREVIRDAVHEDIVGAFHALGLEAPSNLMMSVSWRPTSGRGTINGTSIKW